MTPYVATIISDNIHEKNKDRVGGTPRLSAFTLGNSIRFPRPRHRGRARVSQPQPRAPASPARAPPMSPGFFLPCQTSGKSGIRNSCAEALFGFTSRNRWLSHTSVLGAEEVPVPGTPRASSSCKQGLATASTPSGRHVHKDDQATSPSCLTGDLALRPRPHHPNHSKPTRQPSFSPSPSDLSSQQAAVQGPETTVIWLCK